MDCRALQIKIKHTSKEVEGREREREIKNMKFGKGKFTMGIF